METETAEMPNEWFDVEVEKMKAPSEPNTPGVTDPTNDQQIILAIVYQKQKLGVACYDPREARMYVGEEWEYDDFSTLQLSENDYTSIHFLRSLLQ